MCGKERKAIYLIIITLTWELNTLYVILLSRLVLKPVTDGKSLRLSAFGWVIVTNIPVTWLNRQLQPFTNLFAFLPSFISPATILVLFGGFVTCQRSATLRVICHIVDQWPCKSVVCILPTLFLSYLNHNAWHRQDSSKFHHYLDTADNFEPLSQVEEWARKSVFIPTLVLPFAPSYDGTTCYSHIDCHSL